MSDSPSTGRRRGKPMDMRSLNRTFLWRQRLAADYGAVSARLLSGPIVTLAACPVCDGTTLRPFVVVYGFPYVECAACGHLFSKTQPTQESVQHMYQELGEVRNAQATLYADDRLFDRRVEQIARPKVDHVRTLVPAEGLWVDVGCATGEILTAAHDAGWRVRGIEADPAEVEFSRRKGFDVVEDFVGSENAHRYVFDAQVVSLLNVVEHLTRPSELLSALSSGLRSGSHLVIEVPRHPSLSSFAALLFPQVACRHVYAPEHLHVFSDKSMSTLLAKAGLRTISTWTFGQDFQELISSAALASGIEESGFFRSVCDLAPGLQQAIDDADFSDVMFVVARKE